MADLERRVRTRRKKLQEAEKKERMKRGKLGSESIARAWK